MHCFIAVSAASTFNESRTNQKKNELLLDQKSGSKPTPYKHVKVIIGSKLSLYYFT